MENEKNEMKNSRFDFALCSLNSRLALWLVVSLALSLIFFREFWASLLTMLTPGWIFGKHNAAPWGVLGLCVIWLWLKRRQIGAEMETGFRPVFVLLGLAMVVAAILIPESEHFIVFSVLLASAGVYAALMGRGIRIPAILLSIYGFVVAFPRFVERFIEIPYAMTAIKPLLWLLTVFGYRFDNQVQWVHFTSASGEPVSVAITAACAGPTTMAVFLAIFALMMLDMPLPPKKTIWLLVFGVVGTWAQSIVRLVFLMLVGYQWGRDALFTAHSWSIYVLFPLWYLLFVYVYFRQVGPRGGGRMELKEAQAVAVR